MKIEKNKTFEQG